MCIAISSFLPPIYKLCNTNSYILQILLNFIPSGKFEIIYLTIDACYSCHFLLETQAITNRMKLNKGKMLDFAPGMGQTRMYGQTEEWDAGKQHHREGPGEGWMWVIVPW